MTASAARLVLVDGSSYLFRAYHALPPLTTADGRQTGVVFGVINMLRRLERDYPEAEVAAVFDAPGPTFRHEVYPEYKGTRAETPPDLTAQIPATHELVRALGYPLLCVGGVEADDVIGTLARQAAEAGIETVISTADKDMAQLVCEHVTLINTMTGTVLDCDTVPQKFGVTPQQMVDYLALIGDTVDNIPGVPKVGPKTAAKWLAEHGDLDTLMAAADSVQGKIGDNLRAALEQLPHWRELVTIKCDVELDRAPHELRRSAPDTDRLRELYADLEFRSWLRELDDSGERADAAPPAPAAATIDTTGYDLVLDAESLAGWVQRLRQAPAFAFDIETDSLNYMRARLVGVSFAVAPGEAAYVPCAHAYPGAPEQLGVEAVLTALKPLLEDPERPKIGQNFKYDMSVLARHGIAVRGVAYDTMLESYVLDSTRRHDMDSLAEDHLGHGTIKFTDVAGKGKAQLTFDQVPLEQAGPYAAEDADVTLQLHQRLWPRLQDDAALRDVYETIERPLLPVLSRIERTGVLVDADMLRAQSGELAQQIHDIEQQAHREAGAPFNIASPKQIQEILFERQGLPVLRKTPKGQPSTAEDVLEELADHYPLPRLILEHRALAKLRSTYTEKLPQTIDPDTGRVHTSYHQAVAATGRLSSSDPNLQNIPVRTEQGRRIRKAFIAPPGYRLLSADYSQVELRIMAHLSGDEGLLAAFAAGEDIHRATAAEIFGVPLGEVSTEQRRSAKAINFGLIYGMSAFGLANQLGIDRGSAQGYVDQYFARYPGVREFMDRTRAEAHDRGYVETVFGRRLYLPEINARQAQRRQYAERTAINAPMQGTAADLIKHAMVRIDTWLQDSGTDARMVMQVHDELVLEVPQAQAAELADEVVRLMVGEQPLRVPLVVDAGLGDNWEAAH